MGSVALIQFCILPKPGDQNLSRFSLDFFLIGSNLGVLRSLLYNMSAEHPFSFENYKKFKDSFSILYWLKGISLIVSL